jgi:streptogramin lyase
MLSTITEYPLSSGGTPVGITTGSDGAGGQEIWFTEDLSSGVVAGINASGQVDQQFAVGSDPTAIASATSNGTLWFTQFDPSSGVGSIGMVNPAVANGGYRSVALPSGMIPADITYDPADGEIWFVANDAIGYINPASFTSSSDIHTISLPASAGTNPAPKGITYDPADQFLWFTDSGSNRLSDYDPAAGTFNSVAINLPNASSDPNPQAITADADGNLWFVEVGQSAITSYNPSAGTFGTSFVPPGDSGSFLSSLVTAPDGYVDFTVSGASGSTSFSQVGSFDPASIRSANDITLTPTPTAGADPAGIAVGPDGNIWFTEDSGGSHDQGAIAILPITQLAVNTPSGVVAGEPFSLTVTDEYQNNPSVIDTQFNGDVTISLASGSGELGGSLTAQAVDGVATFTGLTLGQAGTVVVQAVGNDAAGQTGPFTVTSPSSSGGNPSSNPPPPPAPTIIAEQLTAFYARHNKKGKPIGKPVAEVLLTFSAPMNTGTIDNAGNYQVAWESTKKVKHHVQVIYHAVPIAFQPTGSSATVVALSTSVPLKKFAKGGQVTIVSPGSIQSAAGVALGGPTTFTI